MSTQLCRHAASALLVGGFVLLPSALARNASGPAATDSATTDEPGQVLAETASPAAAARPARELLLPEGTEVELEFVEALSSRTAAAGDLCELRLVHDVKVDGVTVIARGARAVGTVVNARRRSALGRAGELSIRIDYLLAGDERLPLRIDRDEHGGATLDPKVTLVMLFGPLGLLRRGKDVEIPAGTPMQAYLSRGHRFTVLN